MSTATLLSDEMTNIKAQRAGATKEQSERIGPIHWEYIDEDEDDCTPMQTYR